MKVNIPVLDHGYVELIESWGSDQRIIESARMSTGKSFLGWGPLCVDHAQSVKPERIIPNVTNELRCTICGCGGLMYQGDEALLRTLYENKHSSPFEMAGATFEVQAPIFVFREWHRHRTQSYSEHSARYTPLADRNYIPSAERLMMASKTNKQAGTAKGAKELSPEGARVFQEMLREQYGAAQSCYEHALACGVPKELARVGLPVGRYSKMRASTDLRNWLGFLLLRRAEGAQWEIREYANVVCEILETLFPRTMSLFLGSDR
jgi:thymidylate synthase (FAD)